MKITEIDYMDYFQSNLLGKNSANFETINRASKLAGRSEHATCPQCAKAEYYELLNLYNRLLPAYLEYLQTKTPVEPIPDIYTRYESVVEDEPTVKSKKTLK